MRSLRGHAVRAGSVTLAALLAVLTLLGVLGTSPGAAVVRVTDGGAWLWSATRGWVTHVNGPSGEPDFNVGLAAARGHPVELAQDGVSVLVTDLQTGIVSRIDPATMDLASRRFGPAGPDGSAGAVRVVARDDLAFVIETDTGLVTRIDPRTLDVIGEQIAVGAPVTGAGIDADRVLWVVVAERGEAIAIRDGQRLATVPVATPRSALGLTIAGGRPVVVDATSPALVPVTAAGARPAVNLPAPAGGHRNLLVAPTIEGRVVPVLVEGTGTVLLIDLDAHGGHGSTQPVELAGQRPSPDLGAPIIEAGRLYVPDNGTGRVLVYDRSARRFEAPIQLAGGAGMLTLFVRNGTVWVNKADGTSAVAVDPEGHRRDVDKYASDMAVPVANASTSVPPPPVVVPSAPGRRVPPTARPSRTPRPTVPARAQPGPDPNPVPGTGQPPTTSAPARPPDTATAPPIITLPPTTPPAAAPGQPSVTASSASGAVMFTVAAGAGGPATTFTVSTSLGTSETLQGAGTLTVPTTGCQTVSATATATGPGGTSISSAPAQALGCVPPGQVRNLDVVSVGLGTDDPKRRITWQSPLADGGGPLEYVITITNFGNPGEYPPETYTTTGFVYEVDAYTGGTDTCAACQDFTVQARNAAGTGPGQTTRGRSG
ncbi:hypothetical protein [Parafrankia sp. EUN1f]|uniref:hypothetical protein n=1 Tax=Parafrankia sp. EUN1f TaxID=102897 RepID=UPI0001C477CD|nr:hypothetical protein [Parafrankia sp. EUN1f]EFC86201.1 hypothetical protein FrEUN1fDRAFT_0638 [Parafrankia sp. EUN1f]